jgi:hypothetical protein
MDILNQETREKNFEVKTALPELTEAYKGLIIGKNEI